MSYQAPVRDMRFVLEELAGLERVAALPGYEDASSELVGAVLEEAARLAGEVLAPLNASGDREGARWKDGEVTTPKGFAEAYKQYAESGWNGLSADPEFGGQGLPELVATATQEMWQAANMAFALCPMLTAGAIEALSVHGSPEQQAAYLPKLVSGQWTGTMNLTEPQAGSDLSAVRTKAVPEGDHYRLFGQKIFITWGEHDVAENIIHLVLARTPDAPEGVKGISLFIVPKFLLSADGGVGARNDLRCVSIEHKLGIHASPTCTMAFGDADGAIGYLVGEEGKGLNYMFTMMNEARHKVGLEGLAIGDRAYQQALKFAKERVQGRAAGDRSGPRVAIVQHADVRRMLMTMKAQVEAMRALCYTTAAHMDLARRAPDAAERAAHQARVDLLIPVVKGWCTELGIEVASTGVQVHGGMGFIEETGAAQHLRDARITAIYEGTNGIQALDLVGRKLIADQGRAMSALVEEIRADENGLSGHAHPDLKQIGARLAHGRQALEEASQWLLAHGGDALATGAVAFPYLMLTGYVVGGWLMGKSALVAQARLGGDEDAFYEAKRVTARFYAEQLLVKAPGLAETIRAGGDATLALRVEQL